MQCFLTRCWKNSISSQMWDLLQLTTGGKLIRFTFTWVSEDSWKTDVELKWCAPIYQAEQGSGDDSSMLFVACNIATRSKPFSNTICETVWRNLFGYQSDVWKNSCVSCGTDDTVCMSEYCLIALDVTQLTDIYKSCEHQIWCVPWIAFRRS
jgi:hypothetical protein